MANCLKIDVNENELSFINLRDSYDCIIRNLGTSPITIVTRKIGSRYYDIICDDCGLLKDDTEGILAGAVCLNYEEFLAGNILITKENYEEFDEKDFNNLKENIYMSKDDVNVDYNTSIGKVHIKIKKDSYFVFYKL